MISRKAKMLSSPEHIQRCLKEGKHAEDLFAMATGLSLEQGMNNYNHVDFVLEGQYGIYGNVDVKSNKPSYRKGYILVEMISVSGKAGWASKSSKADFIAFQIDTGFFIVPKNVLRGVAIKKSEPFDLDKVIRKSKSVPEQDLYKWVGRANRQDVFTYIKKEDLKPYHEQIIYIEL
jgi:hypothetical protein